MADKNKKTDNSNEFDLDAALEEKFQEVQAQLDKFRALNAEKSVQQKPPETTPEPEQPPTESSIEQEILSEEDEETAYPQFDIADALQPQSGKPDTEKSPQPTSEPKQPESPETIHARRNHRRRMLITNRIGAVVRIAAVSAIIFGGSVFLIVGVRPTESAEENRMLAEFPAFSWSAVSDGSYAADVMTYFEDTVPGRSFFKKLISRLETLKGIQNKEEVQFFGDIKQIQNETVPPAATPVSTTSVQENHAATPLTTTTITTSSEVVIPEPEGDPVDVGDGIVLVKDRALSVYGGSFSRGEFYADTLNQFKKSLGDNVNVYSLVAPTAVSFYLPSSYSGYTGSEPDNIDHINENLRNVQPIDAYSALASHVSEDIYARTDHHWLPLGAYYAAEAFAETANVPFADLSDYEKTSKSGYLGSMYTFTKSAALQDNPEDFTYYSPKNHYTTTYYDIDFTNQREGNLMINLDNVEPVSWYLVFMGGDEKITHVHTDCDNNRTLVIVKDSYGNALVPCLTHSFTDIYVIDMRYFELNAVDFMKDVHATDVLFAMNTFSATGGNSECLETIRTQ